MRATTRFAATLAGFAAMLAAGPTAAQDDGERGQDDGAAVRYDVTSDILTEPGRATLDAGIAVQNRTEDDASTTQIVPDVRVIYSATRSLDLEAQVSGNTTVDQTLPTTSGPGSSTADSRFATLSLGARYLIREEGAYPALQGFLRVNAVENTSDDTVFGESGNVGLLLRKSADPVILRSSLTYFRRAERTRNGTDFDPADNLAWRTSLDFFVNDKIALTGDVTLAVFTDDEIGGRSVERRRVAVPVAAGARYSVSSDVVLALEGEVDTANETVTWRLRMQYLL